MSSKAALACTTTSVNTRRKINILGAILLIYFFTSPESDALSTFDDVTREEAGFKYKSIIRMLESEVTGRSLSIMALLDKSIWVFTTDNYEWEEDILPNITEIIEPRRLKLTTKTVTPLAFAQKPYDSALELIITPSVVQSRTVLTSIPVDSYEIQPSKTQSTAIELKTRSKPNPASTAAMENTYHREYELYQPATKSTATSQSFSANPRQASHSGQPSNTVHSNTVQTSTISETQTTLTVGTVIAATPVAEPSSQTASAYPTKQQTLGDRMKSYEAVYELKVPRDKPFLVRLDGRSFSKFTKGMKKPFDSDFRQAMINTAKHLLKESQAKIAYTQSDEITLLFYTPYNQSSYLFNGRIQKLSSILASTATVYFYTEALKRWPEKVKDDHQLPTFDARIFSVSTKMEAFNAILWRQQDSIRNSVQMVARAHFSQSQLHSLNTREMLEKLMKKGVDWNQFSENEKRGTFVRRVQKETFLSEEMLMNIPEKHRPAGAVFRFEEVVLEVPPLIDIENRERFLFDGDTPEVAQPKATITSLPE